MKYVRFSDELGHYGTDARPTCIHFSGNAEYFFVGYSDGSISIFSKNHNFSLLTLSEFTEAPIMNIQTPFIELKVKETKKRIKYWD